MDPRLKTSKKWTSIPDEYLQQVQGALKQTFKEAAQKGEFIAEGRIYPSEILVRLGYLENGRLKQANFEVSLEYDKKTDNALKMINLSIDTCASLLQQYLETPESDEFPRDWKSFDVENRPIFLRHSTVNSGLEEEADKLLGIHDEALVKDGDDDEADKEVAKTVLGLKDEE